MRPLLTPWHRYADGWQRTLRAPYLDAQVLPTGDGWRYDVRTLQNRIVDIGTRPTGEAARIAATAYLLDALEGRPHE